MSTEKPLGAEERLPLLDGYCATGGKCSLNFVIGKHFASTDRGTSKRYFFCQECFIFACFALTMDKFARQFAKYL